MIKKSCFVKNIGVDFLVKVSSFQFPVKERPDESYNSYQKRNLFNWLLVTGYWLLLCFFPQSVGANEPEQTPSDTRTEKAPLTAASDTTRIVKIDYYIDTEPIEGTTEQRNLLRDQTSTRVGDRLSRHAIQQSIKALYTTQQYAEIQVYAQEASDGVMLSYQLTSFARIKAIAITGIPANKFRQTIENAMRLKPGTKYVPAIAKTDINAIKRICEAYGYFNAQVTVPDALTEDGTLTYQMTIGDPSIIKNLQIQGNFAISTERLKRACGFSIRAPIYNTTEVATDVASMEELYRENNYPTATIEPIFNPKTGLLQFQINEGKYVEFDFVSEGGAKQTKFKKGIAEQINTAIPALWERRIKSYFRDQGYHDTTVHEEVLNESKVRLTIDPGTRYRVARITFSGNRAFSDPELRREMITRPIGGAWQRLRANITGLLLGVKRKTFFYEQDLDTDRHRLEILYEKAGYPNRVIEATFQKQNPNNRSIGEVAIHVSILENYKEIIHRCDISGNRAIDTPTLLKRLQSELQLPQPNASFETTVYQNAILKAYRELGYIDAQVKNTYIPETEDPVFEVEGNFLESLADGELPMEIREEFKRHKLSLIGLSIVTNIGNRWSIQDIEGNPRYTLKQESTVLKVFEHGILKLTVLTEGERVTFGKFYFEGDTDIVKPHVLEREVAHLEGSRWTPGKLSRAWQNLYNLGIFHSVEPEPIKTVRIEPDSQAKKEDPGNPHPVFKTYDVSIKVKKQKSRTYRYGGGYSFAEGWRGSLELTDSNFLFKRNIQGRFLSRLGWRDELGYLVDARLTEPWLIGRTRGTLQVSAKKLEVDDNVRALQGSFILSRKLGELHHLDWRYSYRDLNQPVPPMIQPTPTEIGLPQEQNPFSTTVSSLRFSWTYDSLVQRLNPIGGILNEITLEYAGGLLQGETSFIKTTTNTQYYQKLIGDFVLATAVRFGITTGLRSNRRAELISFERFWAGGSTTVRGYAERSLGPEVITGIHRGDVQFIFNTELRFPIYSVVRGAFFLDAGNVWNSLADIETLTRLPAAVGAGLYLDFGALTLGLDYAIPLVSVPSSPDTRVAHFRLGSPF